MPTKKTEEHKVTLEGNKVRGVSSNVAGAQRQHTPQHTPHNTPQHTSRHQTHTPRHQTHTPQHTPHARTPQHQKTHHHHTSHHHTSHHHHHNTPKHQTPAQPKQTPQQYQSTDLQKPPAHSTHKHTPKKLPQIPIKDVPLNCPDVPATPGVTPRSQPEPVTPRPIEVKAVVTSACAEVKPPSQKHKPPHQGISRGQLSDDRVHNEVKPAAHQTSTSSAAVHVTSKKDSQDAMSCLPCRDKDMQVSHWSIKIN